MRQAWHTVSPQSGPLIFAVCHSHALLTMTETALPSTKQTQQGGSGGEAKAGVLRESG